MFVYILRRIVLAIPVMIGVLFLTFLLSRLIPGDPCRAMLGEKATPAVCDTASATPAATSAQPRSAVSQLTA